MSSTWVVVADSARARFFEVGRSRDELREIDDLINSDARLHDRELASDDSGRTFDSFGAGRHAMEDKTSLKEQETIRFAEQINEQLLTALNEGKFNKLIVIADPRFLGILRDKLDKHITKVVSTEIDKDLSRHPTADIASHLPEHP